MDLAAERHRIRELLQRGEVAMLVTFDGGEAHSGRPMLPLWLQKDPHIYFLTHHDSRKVAQIGERPQVALTVVSGGCYFVVLGLAYASRDLTLIRRLWRPTYRAWFPEGVDDREAIVLQMVINKVNYWEPPRCPLRRLFQAVKAVATRRPVRDSQEDDRAMVHNLRTSTRTSWCYTTTGNRRSIWKGHYKRDEE